MGNGYATWFLSPLNLLIDLFCYKNKRIYTLEDFQEESRKEIEGIISVFDTRKEEIIAQVDNAFESGRRGMLVYRWFGKQQNKTIDEFNKPLKYIQTIAISVFDGKESTSFHFGPLRLTLRLLYNLTPVESDDIFIECGHTKHYWHKNPLFIFDDTLMHRSVNNNDARRYCVFMDVIRPSPVTVFLSVLLVPISMIAQPIKGAFYKNWKMLGANRETQGATTKS